jgi:NRPS condensation-like uncharacterized protein
MTGLSSAKQALLRRWRDGGGLPVAAGITADPARRTARGSIQQKELWNLHRRTRATSSSNISFAAIVDAEIDRESFARAVTLLSRRHEILRTSLSVDDNDVVWQHVHDEPVISLIHHDLTGLAPDEAFVRASELANRAASRPFDLGGGPLVRPMLFRLAPGRSMVAVVAHHAVADGWSLAVAMHDITTAYEALAHGKPVDLPPLPLQYKDFSDWQWRWMDSAEAREHARYWEQKMISHKAALLPTDFPRGERKDLRGGLVELSLAEDLTAAVREVARVEQASVFVVLLAAFTVLLRERTGSPVVSVGTPVACRNRPETHPLIGCFASLVPLVMTVEDDASFAELVRAVRAEAAEAITHEEFCLDMYLNRVEPDRDFVGMPLYAAMFGMQPPMQPFELAGARLRPVDLDRGETRTPFAVHLWNTDPRIQGTVGYALSLFRAETVQTMIEQYRAIVRAGTADPATPVWDLLAIAARP